VHTRSPCLALSSLRSPRAHRAPPSFPTRRSSDLGMALPFLVLSFVPALARRMPRPGAWMLRFKQILAFPLYATVVWLLWVLGQQDRKSTRLNSSHVKISYAGFCLKKKHGCRGVAA